MSFVVTWYLYRQSGMVLVDIIDALITTVLAIDSGWTANLKRVNHSGLVHMYVCRKNTLVDTLFHDTYVLAASVCCVCALLACLLLILFQFKFSTGREQFFLATWRDFELCGGGDACFAVKCNGPNSQLFFFKGKELGICVEYENNMSFCFRIPHIYPVPSQVDPVRVISFYT